MPKNIIKLFGLVIIISACFFIFQDSKAVKATKTICICEDSAGQQQEINIESAGEEKDDCTAACQKKGWEYLSYTTQEEIDTAPTKPDQQPADQQPSDTTPSGPSIKSPIKYTDITQLIPAIIKYILGFVGALAVLVIIYSGFLYLTSGGNEKRVTAAKQALTAAIIGLALVFGSYIIVNAVISALGG